MILLDTDILVNVLRDHQRTIEWLSGRDDEIALPGYVAMELVQGCEQRREQRKVESVLSRTRIVWPSPDACDTALLTYMKLHLRHAIGLLDVLIGQTAVELGIPLHTFNSRHYRAIPNLETIRPYKR